MSRLKKSRAKKCYEKLLKEHKSGKSSRDAFEYTRNLYPEGGSVDTLRDEMAEKAQKTKSLGGKLFSYGIKNKKALAAFVFLNLVTPVVTQINKTKPQFGK